MKNRYRQLSVKDPQEADDKFSKISGFGAEIDEWDALNKFSIYKSYKDTLKKQAEKRMAQTLIKEELDKQTAEFRGRKQAFKDEQLRFANEMI